MNDTNIEAYRSLCLATPLTWLDKLIKFNKPTTY